MQQLTQIFQQEGWTIEPIEQEAVRCIQQRCLSRLVYGRMTSTYLLAVVLVLVWFVGRNVLDATTVLDISTRRDMVQMLIWLNALILPVSFLYGLGLALSWREADEAHVVVAKQDDGSFRVSRVGQRRYIHSINEARDCARRMDGYRRNELVLRWLSVCTAVILITSTGTLLIIGLMG